MLSEKLQSALNAQINAEMWSAYLYLSMSMDAAAKGNKGAANWFSVQFQEEQAHARIFIDHIISRGGTVTLAPIAEVQTKWDSLMDAFKDTLAHERKVTAMIHNLCDMAAAEKDYATSNMLTWFVDEQVEEEENAQELIDIMEKVSGNAAAFYMFDKELASRKYAAPSILK